MQHPFEGVMKVAPAPVEAWPTRRSMLGRMFGAVAALLGTGAAASAQGSGRRPTTLALGEEGGMVTTQALGEEGGRVTTQALGEEGGRVTTYALGEEGGRWRPRRGGVTTYAIGEEGGASDPLPPNVPLPAPPPPVPPVPSVPPSRTPTTLALGEEGG